MKKYVYEKGIIYISKPTNQQVKNIKISTLVFLKQVLKEKKTKWEHQ